MGYSQRRLGAQALTTQRGSSSPRRATGHLSEISKCRLGAVGDGVRGAHPLREPRRPPAAAAGAGRRGVGGVGGGEGAGGEEAVGGGAGDDVEVAGEDVGIAPRQRLHQLPPPHARDRATQIGAGPGKGDGLGSAHRLAGAGMADPRARACALVCYVCV